MTGRCDSRCEDGEFLWVGGEMNVVALRRSARLLPESRGKSNVRLCAETSEFVAVKEGEREEEEEEE